MKLTVFSCCISIFVLSQDAQCLTFVRKEKCILNLQVKTDKGVVQGFRRRMDNGKYMFIYQGIPFAKPPLFHLRFRSPQEHTNWSGILDATLPTPSCVEYIFRFSGISIGGTEDCLYLNVYSPVGPLNRKNLPVLFWIYGGSFIEGNTTLYSPENFVAEDVVVVTSNYRVGMFGFLSTEDEAAVGNYGLKDQNAALRWIQRNIKNFGGDPDKVTIMGESAGACSVLYHVVSPKSKGLFQAAIAMSGTNITPWTFKRNPKKIARDISLHMGISFENTTTFVDTLRTMDSESLINYLLAPIIVNFIDVYHSGLMFAPTVEPNHKDAFITESCYTLLETGRFNKVPIIIGVTSMEMNFIYKGLPLLRPLLILFDLSPSLIPTGMNISSFYKKRTVGHEIKQKYFKSGSLISSTDEELLHYISDVFFVKPMYKVNQLAAQYVPVYMYVFDYKGEPGERILKNSNFDYGDAKGIGHTEDLAYIWNIPNVTNERDNAFIIRYTKIWTHFIKYRNPTPEEDETLQSIIWPPNTTPESTNYLHIGDKFEVRENYRMSYMKFWNNLYEKFCEKPFFTY